MSLVKALQYSLKKKSKYLTPLTLQLDYQG